MTSMTSLLHQVPFFKYPFCFDADRSGFEATFREVAGRGAFILQKDLEQLESRLAAFLGCRHVLGVGNATDGLLFAARAAGIGAGDEVILSSHTMIATAAAVHFAGAIPIPVECGADHLIDPVAVEAAVTPRTRAILPTQLNGRTCEMDVLAAIAARHGLVILEDAAQGLGSRFKGQCAGTFGVAAAFSFYPAKVLGCFGDGGAVTANDAAVHEKIVQMRDHGRNSRGEIVSWGMNSRLDNLQAAFLDLQLARYDATIARRRELAGLYQDRLGDVAELVLPPAPNADPDHFDIFQNYEIEAERRDALKAALAEQGIGTLIQWGGQAVHQLKSLGFTQHLPRTDWIFSRMLLLPMNLSLTDSDVDYVCDAIREFFGYAR